MKKFIIILSMLLFMGCDMRFSGNKIVIEKQGKTESIIISESNPLVGLKEVLAQYQPVEVEGLPRFSGGAVGFVSYDMVRSF